jgi:hypothetical protein
LNPPKLRLPSAFLLAALAVSPIAQAAEDCKKVSFDWNGGPFDKIPVYDQAKFYDFDTNICYAIAGAEIQDADRFFRGDTNLSQLTSPVLLASTAKANALAANDSPPPIPYNPLALGHTKEALDAGRSRPACDQNFFERYVSLFAAKTRISLGEKPLPESSSSLPAFFQSLLEQKFLAISLRKLMRESEAPPGSWDEECSLNPFIEGRLPPGENLRQIHAALLKALEPDSLLKDYDNVAQALCRGHTFEPKTGKAEKFDGFTEEERQRLEKDFELAKNPFRYEEALADSLDFSRTVPRQRRLKQKALEILDGELPSPLAVSFFYSELLGDSKSTAKHVAVVIRKDIGPSGKCSFLLRDSYGLDCSFSRKKPGVLPCEHGNIWVPVDDLMNVAVDLTWIPR